MRAMASISTLVDRVKVVVQSSGVGPFLLGPAVKAYRGAEALIDGATYSYALESGAQYEVGTGAYTQSSGTLVRTPILSSNGGAAVSFPANVELNFTALAKDIVATGASLPIVQEPGSSRDVAMSQASTTNALLALADGVTSTARAAINGTGGLEYDPLTGVMTLASLPDLLPFLNGAAVQATEALTAGMFVNVYAAAGAARVRKAVATDPQKYANGFVLANAANGATAVVILEGPNIAVNIAGVVGDVWLSAATPGGWTQTPPSGDGQIVQLLGTAIPNTGVFFSLRGRVLL